VPGACGQRQGEVLTAFLAQTALSLLAVYRGEDPAIIQDVNAGDAVEATTE
jgi:hypothetical protein